MVERSEDAQASLRREAAQIAQSAAESAAAQAQASAASQ